jgi:hypothetical protein
MGMPEFANIGQVHCFFAVLISHPFSGRDEKHSWGHERGKPNMARRQTETTYAKSLLLWLCEYWIE